MHCCVTFFPLKLGTISRSFSLLTPTLPHSTFLFSHLPPHSRTILHPVQHTHLTPTPTMATLTGFKSHGIREPLTNRIAGILDEYPDGTQIARELLQNSDDARSKRQWYLLDHRDRRQANGLRLFHGDLIEYMGPALLAGNDTKFEDKDFVSMKNLAASEKKTDQTKIGQMGIGFNRYVIRRAICWL